MPDYAIYRDGTLYIYVDGELSYRRYFTNDDDAKKYCKDNGIMLVKGDEEWK